MKAETARDLHNDKRGAIMLMGLGMSCFLIGGLWFLIGIGDSLVFRDSMQEAADHAAFTSAVLHAKGMNFISACNLILLALISIHIVMGLIHDILLAICIIGALFSAGTACIPWTRWRPIYTGYGKGFKQVANVIHYLEQGAAVGYPFIGVAKAYTLGNDYGNFGPKKHNVNMIALSTSLVPGSVMSGAVNKIFRQSPAEKLPGGVQGPTRQATGGYSAGTKSFLPVETKHFDEVCKRIANKGLDFLIGLTGRSPGRRVMKIVKGIIGSVLVLRYCNDLGAGALSAATGGLTDAIGKGNAKIDEDNALNNSKLPEGEQGTDIEKVKTDGIGGTIDPGFDSWWGKDGPFVPWGGTANGNAWQQIWTINLLPEFKDAQQHRVHVGTNNKHVESDAKVWGYFAQAEFFFDCADTWFSDTCNYEDNAAYSIKWRAKLRRLQAPQMGDLLGGFAGQFLKNLAGYKRFKDLFKNSDAAKKLGDTVGGAVGVSAIQGAIGALFGIGEAEILKLIRQGGGLINQGQNGLIDFNAYH